MRSPSTKQRRGRSAKSDRKVLMIAYAFPPTGGPGVQRPAKFAKYLPQFGWKPIVWTSDCVEGLPRDASLLDELPQSVEIHHPPTVRKALTAARRALASVAHAAMPAAARRVTQAVEWRLASRKQTEHADLSLAWAKRSLRPLLELVDREAPAVIFSTYSPASNHRLALELKRRLCIPWIADFRDLWIDDCRYREGSPARRAADARLQQEILEQADVVIGVSPRQTEILASHLPAESHKFVSLTNGFDPEDFQDTAAPSDRSDTGFTIVYAGRFDRVRAQPELVGGLRHFAAEVEGEGSRITLRIAGHAGSWLLDRLRDAGLRVQYDGYVRHRQAIEAMLSADLLLLPMPRGRNGESIISGKLFEYLAARRPILVVGPENGECERIVRECNAGRSAPFDAAAIAGELRAFHTAWRTGRPIRGCSEEALDAFSRVELTRRLTDILNDLSAESSPRRGRNVALAGVAP